MADGPSQPASPGSRTREPHNGGASPRVRAFPAPPCQPLPPVPLAKVLQSSPDPPSPQALVESLSAWVWKQHRKLPALLPAPLLLSLSSHIELAISVSATLSGLRQGRGWSDRAPLSRWCMSVSSFLSVCYPCPVLLLAPSLTLREAPVWGDSKISLGSHGGYRGGSGWPKCRGLQP